MPLTDPGTFTIKITRREYDTDGYHDGDQGECLDESDESQTYDAYDTSDPDDVPVPPVAWAISVLRDTASFESSEEPVPAELWADACLTATEPHLYTSHEDEIKARLTGDWTDAQRAEVFRGATARR
jgi:hypothetical protein